MDDVPTHDPHVVIEAEGLLGDGRPCVQYRRTSDGRRWRVIGRCVGLGHCWEGAAGPPPALDCPVTPEFAGCCPFEYEELEGAG